MKNYFLQSNKTDRIYIAAGEIAGSGHYGAGSCGAYSVDDLDDKYVDEDERHIIREAFNLNPA